MADRTNFIAQDYPLAFDLQILFQKYVDLFTELNFPEDKEPYTLKERQELNLKLHRAKNEITLRVLQMKQTTGESDFSKNLPPLPAQPHEYRLFN